MAAPTDVLASTAPDGTVYDVYGPADGPVVVLIHGLGLSRELWQPHLAAFTDRYRVINYDLFGHGDSAPVTGDASLSLYADQIASLMNHVQAECAAIVGFSIGGMINRRFALDHGDRAASLVILNSPHDRGDEAQADVEARALTVRNQGALATMDAALIRWFTPGHLERHPEHESQVRRWRTRVDPESYAQAAWVLANGVRELIEPDPAVIKPTLVMTGENDTGSTPAMAHAIATEIPGSETIIVDELKHLGLVEQPATFTEPIRTFLDRTS